MNESHFEETNQPKDDVKTINFLYTAFHMCWGWVLDSNFANLAHQVLGNRGLA